MIDRNKIIKFLKDFSIQEDYVNAMWLEGADGINKVDEYSDIDFWFDVKKEYQETFLYECIDKLKELGTIDSRVDKIRNDVAQSNIHLSNTSEYLTLDICVQSHEIRGTEGTCFVKNDIAEQPLILFDKLNIILFKDEIIDFDEIKEIYLECSNRILQKSRVIKYINRGKYLEAYMKYIENIANPLVKIARLIYTPRHYDYILCHISDHLPEDIVKELEYFYQINSLQDIDDKIEKAQYILEKYKVEILKKYNISLDDKNKSL